MSTTEERRVTAHHEAGHAIAALMRGGGEVTSITIDPTADYMGCAGVRSKSFDTPFIIFAGPWAEARCQWTGDTLDGLDDDGCEFIDHVTAAFMSNSDGDGTVYGEALEHDVYELARRSGFLAEGGMEVDRETAWSEELERMWPVVQLLAERLLIGAVSGQEAADLVDEGLGRR
jgi:hypothetical protein